MGSADETMLEGVLHLGLKHEARDHGVQQAFGNVFLDLEPILEADALDAQVIVENRQFLPKGDFLFASEIERSPKQITQARQHLIRSRGVPLDEGGYRVERVEEEMRLELHAQHLVLGLGKTGLQLGGMQLTGLEAPVHVHGRERAHGDEEVHEGQVEIPPEEVAELGPDLIPGGYGAPRNPRLIPKTTASPTTENTRHMPK